MPERSHVTFEPLPTTPPVERDVALLVTDAPIGDYIPAFDLTREAAGALVSSEASTTFGFVSQARGRWRDFPLASRVGANVGVNGAVALQPGPRAPATVQHVGAAGRV